MLRLTLITSLCLSLTTGVAQLSEKQNAQIDSLKQVIEAAKHDSFVVKAYKAWGKIIYLSDPPLDLELNEKIIKICNKNLENGLNAESNEFYYKSVSDALNNLGLSYKILGDYKLALDHYDKSLKFSEERGDKKGMARTLHNIGTIYSLQTNFKQALKHYDKCLNIFQEIGYKKGIATSYNNIGLIYYNQGNFGLALEYYDKCLMIEEEIGDKLGIAMSWGNFGNIFKDQGNYKKALEYNDKCLEICQEIGHKWGMAGSLANIGLIYHSQGNYEKALEYYDKCLNMEEEIGNKNGMAISLANIGLICHNQGNSELALEYLDKSFKIRKEIGDKLGIAQTLNNIGRIYYEQDNYEQARENYDKSLTFSEEIGNKQGMAGTYNNIGVTHKDQGNYEQAFDLGKKGLTLAQEVGAVEEISNASNLLYEVYKKTGQPAKALEMHELYIEMRDSINSIENKEAAIKLEYQHAYEKEQALADAKHQEQLALSEEREKRQKLIAYSAGGGLVMVLLFAFFIFNRLQVTRRQKKVIEEQKQKVEEQKKDITDSIRYAENIQKALLPAEEDLSLLPEGFVLFQPKDIVSGDFYWMQHHNNKVYFAACDCTGHGVPGAFMSMIGSSLLDEAVVEKGITQPNEIFFEVRKGFINALKQTGETQKDGMDAVLCSWNKNGTLEYSLAYTPLLLIRKGEIIETKADKQPVGFHTGAQKLFTHHEHKLEKGDTIYLFSDGYPDQFGGPKDKKFMMKNFKKLLLSIQDKTMNEQKTILETTMAEWKGETEQVDDILVMGVRF